MISRVDNIGDVILTLPLCQALKQHYPNVKIIFLARNYVRSIVQLYSYIDQFIAWDELEPLIDDEISKHWKNLNVDVFINVLPRKRIAKLAYKAKIPTRIGSYSRFFHWVYCNRYTWFSRRKSLLHEAQFNLKILEAFKLPGNYSLADIIPMCKLSWHGQRLPHELAILLDSNKFNLIVHPGTHGHAREWPTEYFVQLINELPADRFKIFITGTSQEGEKFRDNLIKQCPQAIDITGRMTLEQFMLFIASADGLIANSTGPLHVAAVSSINCLGLFPKGVGISPTRWAPLGEKAQYLVMDDPCPGCQNDLDCVCIKAIKVSQVKKMILGWDKLHLSDDASEILIEQAVV